jgi:membrane fusion protein (multidrug efflux system)
VIDGGSNRGGILPYLHSEVWLGWPIDDPNPVRVEEPATWQSDAEWHAEHGQPRWRHPLGLTLGIIVALAVIGAGVAWLLRARHNESTDDAFVDGYVTQVAPQVAGRATRLQFSDN